MRPSNVEVGIGDRVDPGVLDRDERKRRAGVLDAFGSLAATAMPAPSSPAPSDARMAASTGLPKQA